MSYVLDEIGSLTKLKCLDLSRNELTELPDGLFTKLASLQTLNLDQNKLSSLPEMSGLEGLITFRFGSNQIKQVGLVVLNILFHNTQVALAFAVSKQFMRSNL